MAYVTGLPPGLGSRRLPREWPAVFNHERKPLEPRPWIESLRELTEQHRDGIELFMRRYDDDRAPPQVEAVLDYCRNVSENDFRDTRKMGQGEAWLDDRAAPPVPIHASTSNVIVSNTMPIRPPGVGSHLDSIECDITDAHERRPLDSTRSAVREARTYDERLTAWDLRGHLRERRFDHDRLEDADRRLIYIGNPSPCHMVTLTATATEHQAPAIQDLLGQWVTFQTSMRVKISRGYRVFQLEHHFPYFTLQKTKPEGLRKPGSRQSDRELWIDLSFLDPSDEPDPCGMYQAQSSFTVSGSDNHRWIAYNLEDISSQPDREIGEDERNDHLRSDQISMGKFDANMPFYDAREYFLAIGLVKVTHARKEFQRVFGRVEASFRHHMTCRPFSTASATEQSAIVKWNEPMLELLAILIQDLREKVDCWDNFMGKDVEYFNDPNATRPPKVMEHIGRTINELEDIYEELRVLLRRLSDFQESCEKLANRLEYRLSLQGGKIGEFTVLFISPVVIVSSVFAVPVPVLLYERNGRSFFLSVLAVALLMWLLLRLREGWLTQQDWWEKLLRRGRTVRRRRDSSIVAVHEGELSVLRRRNTHANFARDRG